MQTGIDVKSWMAAVPAVDAVRPGSCPLCGAASRPVGGAVVLWGHGLRKRHLRGPLCVDGTPQEVEVALRRYLCRCCGAVISVGPAGVLAGRLYTAMAIGLAFALYGIERLSHPKVRQRLSPWQASQRDPARTLWVTLVRWIDARRRGVLFAQLRSPPFSSRRQIAEQTAQGLGALAVTRASALRERVFCGAMQCR